MDTRRHALSLAAVLAATALTGVAAVFGLTRAPAQHLSPQPAIVQAVQPAQPAQHWEEGD